MTLTDGVLWQEKTRPVLWQADRTLHVLRNNDQLCMVYAYYADNIYFI